MTLLEVIYLLVLITIINVGMLVARLWSVDIGLVIAAAPFALMAVLATVCTVVERMAERVRVPQARVVAMRRAS
jgi:hypothetical protein